MEDQNDKELDALIRKLLSDTTQVHPSPDFTRNVMQEIVQLELAKKSARNPLIPRLFWGIVISIYLLVMWLLFKNNILLSKGWFSELGNRTTSLFNLDFPSLNIPFAAIYGILCATLMVMLQVILLRRRWRA